MVNTLRESAYRKLIPGVMSYEELLDTISIENQKNILLNSILKRSDFQNIPNNIFQEKLDNISSEILQILKTHEYWGKQSSSMQNFGCILVRGRELREIPVLIPKTKGYAVVFSDALLLFVIKFARIIGHIMAQSSEAVITAQLKELLIAHTTCGHPGLVKSGPPPTKEIEIFTYLLTETIMTFLVARAVAVSLVNTATIGDLQFREYPEGAKYHEMEFDLVGQQEIDNIAIDLMARLAMKNKIQQPIYILSPYSYFLGIKALEQFAQSLLINPNNNALAVILPKFSNERMRKLHENSSRLHPKAKNKVMWLNESFEYFLKLTKGHLAALKKLGIVPGFKPRTQGIYWLSPMVYEAETNREIPFYWLKEKERMLKISKEFTFLGEVGFPFESDVLVCYRGKYYINETRHISSILQEQGILAYHDELFVKPNKPWKEQVKRKLLSTRLIVLLVPVLDLGSETDIPMDAPIMEELKWASNANKRICLIGVNKLGLSKEAGAIAFSTINILQATVTKSFKIKKIPIILVQNEASLLNTEFTSVIVNYILSLLSGGE